MRGSVGLGEIFIMVFISVIFITGAVVLFKFMRGGKK
jgi:hypothetical protein